MTFFNTFFINFSNLIFSWFLSQNASQSDPQNGPKSTKIGKKIDLETHPQSRHQKNLKIMTILTHFCMIFLCFFNRNLNLFFALQAWLHKFKKVIWTHYLLCLQHVGYFAETSKNQKVLSFFESFSYRFLITFRRGPDLLKMSQNASQNGASGHPKSRKIKKIEHSKNSKKTTPEKSDFGCNMIPKWD